jgi:hypothetical protein
VTRVEEVFNCEMEHANHKRAIRDVYWTGYRAGLMRAHFGHVAVGDKHHDELQQIEALGDMGRGYRDGYAKLTCQLAAPQELLRSAGAE